MNAKEQRHTSVGENDEFADLRPTGESEQHLSCWTRAGWKLFLLGFLTLFLELFFIRYLAGSVWNLGYFPNIVLLSAFIGIGIGFVFHQRLTAHLSKSVFRLAFMAALALIIFVSYRHPVVPGFDAWHYNLDGDLYFSFVPFEVNDLNYVFFTLCFMMVALIFACISQRTAKLFRQFAPLNAYTLDILGSCAGILSFIAISALQLPAWSWFGIFTIIFVLSMSDHWRMRLVLIGLAMIALIVMYREDLVLMRDPESKNPLQTYWSPYQKVEYVEEAQHQPGDLRRRIFVNGLDHQEMHVNVTKIFYQLPYLHRAKAGLPRYQNVLVIGAGSGNDVTAALQNEATHVDAVEIDPVIARLGREHNPSRAYLDPRVTVHIDDGRAFMIQTKQKYDLIIFALTDSLVKVSSLSQLRLENYLFTRESITRACDLLNDHGNIVFYNYYRLPFVAERIQQMIGEATGSAPQILSKREDFYMVSGEKRTTHEVKPVVKAAALTLPTDDWPFLYLEKRRIPNLYLKAMAGVSLIITGLLVVLRFSTRKRDDYRAPGMLAVKLAFVFMGIAFLLLETKSIIQFSLLFGTTWLNNSLIFLAVLISVLAANWTVQWFKTTKSLWLLYGLLVISALSSVFFPFHELLHIQSVFLRFIAASLLTFCPIYFANLIFSSIFKDQKIAEHIFGWNLLGATFGGVLEYSSMAIGYNALSFIVVACYTLVFVLLLQAKRRITAATPATTPRDLARDAA